jgi:hypothetical protein
MALEMTGGSLFAYICIYARGTGFVTKVWLPTCITIVFEHAAALARSLIPVHPVYHVLVYFSSAVSSLAKSCSFNNAVISSALHSLW